ncbi:MAG: ISNCY family transposase [Candidatus Rokuibacteriota bacterium]
METFTMSRKEVPRAGLVQAALAGRITNAQGAAALHLTVRQFQRLKVRFRAEHARGLVHRARGQPSPRRLPPEIRDRIAQLLQTTYLGFNDCHFTDKLHEIDDPPLHVSRATVRRLRRALGLPAKRRRRRRQARHRRIPEAAMGTLIQVDASPFAWLEGRGPGLTLAGAIDDATGAILGLTFRPTEDLHGYAVVLHQVFTTYGLPLAVYGDGINILVRNDAHWTLAEQLAGAQTPTHLGRVLQELGIGYIQARSPQAKGRIERLWGTLQDRLVSELRLAGVSSLEMANAFLPAFIAAFNRRFARPPQDLQAVWRRPPADLDLILSCRYSRVVGRDHTVRVGDRCLQLPRQIAGRSYAGYRVEVRELLSGELIVLYHDAPLATQQWPGAFTLKPRAAPSEARQPPAPPPAPRATPPAPAPRPPAAHPWRRTPFSRGERLRQAAQRGMTFSRTS